MHLHNNILLCNLTQCIDSDRNILKCSDFHTHRYKIFMISTKLNQSPANKNTYL